MNTMLREKRQAGELAPACSPLSIAGAAAAWILVFDNISFWKTFFAAQPGALSDQLVAGSGLAVVLAFVLTAVFLPLISTFSGRLLVAAILLISGAVAHYMDAWGIVIDRNLLQNIGETDVREVSELLALPTFLDIALRGVLPATLVAFVPLRRVPRARIAVLTLMLASSAAITVGLLVMLQYGTLATTFRNHRELRLQLVPSNYIKATHSYFKGAARPPGKLRTVAPDAARSLTGYFRPRVLVLMVGETARAANFSLGGYARPTNRHLEKSEVTYFSNMTSCGTDTATSLPCMFSDLGTEDFSLADAKSRENALDVLARTGVKVTWLENNSGCKGVCARVLTIVMPDHGPAAICSDSGCHDEILVHALGRSLDDVQGDSLLVMHLMGSHGPSYFKRYPPPGPFQPTCDTNRLQTCERDALLNTYDNTIDYTSKVIADALKLVNRYQSGMDISLIYVSDHGESLGEKSIYLHGLPPPIAPREQLEIPMIGWISQSASSAVGVSSSCLAKLSNRPLSHDNLFHTLLGYHGISSSAYKPELDIFAIARRLPTCAPPPP